MLGIPANLPLLDLCDHSISRGAISFLVVMTATCVAEAGVRNPGHLVLSGITGFSSLVNKLDAKPGHEACA